MKLNGSFGTQFVLVLFESFSRQFSRTDAHFQRGKYVHMVATFSNHLSKFLALRLLRGEQGKPVMHYQNLHGGDLNENGNFDVRKLEMHYQILHAAILTKISG